MAEKTLRIVPVLLFVSAHVDASLADHLSSTLPSAYVAFRAMYELSDWANPKMAKPQRTAAVSIFNAKFFIFNVNQLYVTTLMQVLRPDHLDIRELI